MDILEAFEKSDKIKIWDEAIEEWYIISIKDKNITTPTKFVASDRWQPIIEPLTFEKIKAECVMGESLLVSEKGFKRLYLGFNRTGNLITDWHTGLNCSVWVEPEIKNWKISDEKWRGE